jgi:predicted HicB family RNase H-like nuclease
MNTMTYKGYSARIEYDDKDNIFVGHLVGINDIVGFHAESVAELQAAFRESVDDYLDVCEKLGQSPNKPASGKMVLRIPPEIHTAAMTAAKLAGLSLNKWAADVFRKAANS